VSGDNSKTELCNAQLKQKLNFIRGDQERVMYEKKEEKQIGIV